MYWGECAQYHGNMRGRQLQRAVRASQALLALGFERNATGPSPGRCTWGPQGRGGANSVTAGSQVRSLVPFSHGTRMCVRGWSHGQRRCWPVANPDLDIDGSWRWWQCMPSACQCGLLCSKLGYMPGNPARREFSKASPRPSASRQAFGLPQREAPHLCKYQEEMLTVAL